LLLNALCTGDWLTIFNYFILLFFSREMPLVELKSKYRKVSSIDKIGNGWQEEYDASSKQVTLKLNKLIQC
jgi:hypothetical protein